MLSVALPPNSSPKSVPPTSKDTTNTYVTNTPAVSDGTKTTKPSLNELLSIILPQWRLEQGLQVLEREYSLPYDIKCTGPFIQWVVNDVLKEENDRIQESDFDGKQLVGVLALKATAWYLAGLKESWYASAKKTCASTSESNSPDWW